MAQIDKPNLHFNTKLYTGNGSTQSITGVGFQPDWTWIKERGAVNNHELYDVVRGVTKRIYSDLNNVEDTNSTGLTAFGTDGFTLGGAGGTNNNSDTYVAWNWKAGGSGSTNTDGSITSTVSVNTTAGFSVVKFSPTGSGSVKTVGHGLGEVPKMIIMKRYTGSVVNWLVYHVSTGNGNSLYLDTTDASTSVNYWNSTTPTSSVFTVNGAAEASGDFIAYCFAEKKGYSSFGSYTGNNNASGPFVYTGFKPAFVVSKRSDSTDGWRMMDTARSTYNVAQHRLLANASDAEVVLSSQDKDFLSNGFKIRTSDSGYNASGGTFIYMAFAENPIVGSNNVPAVAR